MLRIELLCTSANDCTVMNDDESDGEKADNYAGSLLQRVINMFVESQLVFENFCETLLRVLTMFDV